MLIQAAPRNAAILLVYALGFGAAHSFAAFWGGSYYYSLLYPAAGFRFALLWWGGPIWTAPIAVTELVVQVIKGRVMFDSPALFDQIVGVVRVPILYGLVIWATRWLTRRPSDMIGTTPMPFALAAVLGPLAVGLFGAAWEALRPGGAHPLTSTPEITTVTAFLTGDLLGVLIFAPPILWAVSALQRGRRRLSVQPAVLIESVMVYLLGLGFSQLMTQVGISMLLTPVLLATAWIGLRGGRATAWVAIMATALIVLPRSTMILSTTDRLALHIGLATVAIAGYLAGSFADAQRQSQADLARRDRLLFQAERLKTLRAMSVAVIHEISQPLSTLAIEARHLAAMSDGESAAQSEAAYSAKLISRNVDRLSQMVRRLRRFGSRAMDESGPVACASLLQDAAGLLEPELRAAGVALALPDPLPDLLVIGEEVELVQLLLNLIRNAIAATPNGTVRVQVEADGRAVRLSIANRSVVDARPKRGMGVGLLIARAIVEAHGGTLSERTDKTGDRVFDVQLQRWENPA